MSCEYCSKGKYWDNCNRLSGTRITNSYTHDFNNNHKLVEQKVIQIFDEEMPIAFCPFCGSPLSDPTPLTKICPKCNRTMAYNSYFGKMICRQCGYTEEKPKDREGEG